MTGADDIAAAVPRLRSFVRLQADPVRGGWVLQAPERVLALDENAHAILNLCDGDRTVAVIIGDLAADYDASPGEIGADVIAVLRMLADRDFLTFETPGDE